MTSKPKAPQTAFFFFSRDRHAAVRATYVEEKVPASEIAKKLRAMWRAMTDAQKQSYQEMALADKERYTTEKAKWMQQSAPIDMDVVEQQPKILRKSPKSKTDTPKPSPAHTAFFFFSRDRRAAVRATFREEKVPASEVAKKLGEMWRAMTDAQKQSYQEMALADKERYHREKAVLTL